MEFESENLLDANIEKEYVANKGYALVGAIIGLVVAIIVIVAVGIPVTQSVISSANLTGTTATVVGLVPLFFGLLALVSVASLFGG
jgi:hypothetical protein